MKKGLFIKKTKFKGSPDDLFKWHERPGALERLSPPWDPVEVISRNGGIKEGGKVKMYMKAGPVKYIWKALHTEYEEGKYFRDIMEKGPLSEWSHTHSFIKNDENNSFLEDKIQFALPLKTHGINFFKRFIKKNLDSIFNFRHKTLGNDLHLHNLYGKEKKTILISGASGLLGSALTPFFTTGGHEVLHLVRREPENENEIFWDPKKKKHGIEKSRKIDVIINLSGEHIGEGRWTDSKKKRIIDSRIDSTSLLIKLVSELDTPPEVMLSASAIGYYGGSEKEFVDENSSCGNDFISEVCNLWEDAALPVKKYGTRLVLLRIGVVLSPLGGALERMLQTIKFGVGGRLGNGKQYISWITTDDVINAIYFAMHNKEISGPLNLVTPTPVTNNSLTKSIGKILKRPTIFPVPALIIKVLFGEMGKEIVLSGVRVKPDKLINSGFTFLHEDLELGLRFMLGRE